MAAQQLFLDFAGPLDLHLLDLLAEVDQVFLLLLKGGGLVLAGGRRERGIGGFLVERVGLLTHLLVIVNVALDFLLIAVLLFLELGLGVLGLVEAVERLVEVNHRNFQVRRGKGKGRKDEDTRQQ